MSSQPDQNLAARVSGRSRSLLVARAGALGDAIERALAGHGTPVFRIDPDAVQSHPGPEAEWDLVIVVDLPAAPWRDRITDAMVRRGQGRIVHVSDRAPDMTAARLAQAGINENWVRWAGLEGDEGQAGEPPAAARAEGSTAGGARSAIGRPVACAEVAAAVVFLASPDAGYLVGAEIPVTGGLGLGLYPEQLG